MQAQMTASTVSWQPESNRQTSHISHWDKRERRGSAEIPIKIKIREDLAEYGVVSVLKSG